MILMLWQNNIFTFATKRILLLHEEIILQHMETVKIKEISADTFLAMIFMKFQDNQYRNIPGFFFAATIIPLRL